MMRLIRLKGQGGVGALRRALEAARDLTNAGFVVRVRVQVDAVPGPRARPGGLPVGFARGLEVHRAAWEGLEEEAPEAPTP
ncbi:hypothetical protein TthAA37_09510 [Thermus thermophilus]|uniref:Uncharacterized protein n=1 Tax=Thermus thermophilus TaxID=274 RepID=A0AAD1NWX6_THETH|nr:hypothetical protein [Thermus thermophilus]BCZ86753.1 hypothetical protein TthAA11_09350 [Thermus thermophilus]BCZ89131.1 hypothetical protein TthAA22_09360 [Thermus thermophilus]BCZ91762.1 hypothetical protein TthAA37_09510 [Thermus thermophilus]BCZ94305.1 hypothetical protein TthAK1_09220 [Thermus thermophilus]